MKHALLLAAAIFAIASPVLQAADRLQVNTEVTVDGKVVHHMTAYVANGEKIHYSRNKTHEVVTGVVAGKPHKKLEPIGFEANITPRITSDGEVLITSSASYVGVNSESPDTSAGSSIKITDFWQHRLGATRLGDLGERISLDHLEKSSSGHTVDVAVTVTRT
ncbi:hypothetical protein H8F21_13965 [Pseudomonas sp. P66]|uniref:Uncharacterized protein n=1 Tax=Pseudomonas arcuscaelestis TaxID=2710591 RepID=A0ABS2BYH4_9PSED|nr:hypothetical protein [Pseudomonas arcuscaelestis]MBM5458670.1 hypothetical protein [Pseudomonas arcuscaelestis]